MRVIRARRACHVWQRRTAAEALIPGGGPARRGAPVHQTQPPSSVSRPLTLMWVTHAYALSDCGRRCPKNWEKNALAIILFFYSVCVCSAMSFLLIAVMNNPSILFNFRFIYFPLSFLDFLWGFLRLYIFLRFWNLVLQLNSYKCIKPCSIMPR